jgi:hypothetical protein
VITLVFYLDIRGKKVGNASLLISHNRIMTSALKRAQANGRGVFFTMITLLSFS